ncbi:MAG: hypothetical protein WEA77_02415 [Hyphomonas sp.]|uniref:hypothetical protein n=1 Tax=Hyphomonas sp. TaxID=87 RepID=UPI0034A0A961
MPLQNRVDPFGALHGVPARGLLMGKRGGCLRRPDQTLKARRWTSRRWIICVLSFKDRRRKLMQPGFYTELFFLDEATELAGGHRPCFEGRRADASRLRDALVYLGYLEAGEMVDALDVQVAGETQAVMRETVQPHTLPDGAMHAAGERAWLKHAGAAQPWSFAGYGPAQELHERSDRLTPRLTCGALGAGYSPVIYPSVYA